jgi:hypothetical protein
MNERHMEPVKHRIQKSNHRLNQQRKPPEVFLSHARINQADVTQFEMHLKARGLRVWRDIPDLIRGEQNEDAVRASIHRSDAFLLWLTEECLQSDFIWRVEVQTAIECHQANPEYSIIPVFWSVPVFRVRNFCLQRNLVDVTKFAGDVVMTNFNIAPGLDEYWRVAYQCLRSLCPRQRRRFQDRPFNLVLRTSPDDSLCEGMDLDLDWSSLFESPHSDPRVWDDLLLPALQDVRRVVGRFTFARHLNIRLQARLSAAFAFGRIFPTTSRFNLTIDGGHGIWRSSYAPAATKPLRITRSEGSGHSDQAVVQLSITRDLGRSVSDYLTQLQFPYGPKLDISPLDGISNVAVRSGKHALAMAVQVGQEIKRLRDLDGVRQVHLFAALPAPLALLIGRQCNATIPIHIYHSDQEHGFVRTCQISQ